ncbi:MAG: XRE family transcriptional regulator [Mesorhizobium sp.]|uniref:helix-turn-helix transcriptional regulator n=1 Tax=Mesorhizobium sp. TaxID=1871066 RepID=UPI000FE5B00F|nr:helix-turn-helix transcriptional regulator [Mesorhizobium sp.]RWF74503.1 MAG: XRE family transcriptional regulator [Mesorhizobium sp.]TIN82121.1 MAG: helix-turn-helix transcriptional regulator [Mesorhizobium sp.]
MLTGPRHREYPPKTRHDLTRELFAELHAHGLTIQAIAEGVSYPGSTLKRWRNGRGRPRVIDLENVGAQYGLDLAIEVLPMAGVAPERSPYKWEPRTASPVTRELFQLMSDWGVWPASVARAIGMTPYTFKAWARGHRSPYINEMEAAAHAIGCRLAWVKR